MTYIKKFEDHWYDDGQKLKIDDKVVITRLEPDDMKKGFVLGEIYTIINIERGYYNNQYYLTDYEGHFLWFYDTQIRKAKKYEINARKYNL